MTARPPSRRAVLRGAAAGAALAAGAASGCGFGRGSGDGLVFGFHGDSIAIDTYQRIAELYQRRRPGVRVRCTYADSLGFFQRLPLMFRAGTAPDVVLVAESWVSGLSQLGGYADLTPFLEREGLGEDSWVPGALTPARIQGRTLCLPCLVYPKGIAYNRTLLRAAGVPDPRPGWREAELVETAAAVGHGSGAGRTWGLHNGFGTAQPWDVPTIHGSLPFDPYERRMTATDPRVVSSLQLLADLVHEHDAMPGAAQEQDTVNFTSGRFGLALFAGHSLTAWTEQIGSRFEWGVVPYPAEWSGTYQNANAAVFEGSHRKEEAFAFARFLATDPEAQEMLGRLGTPALRETTESWRNGLPAAAAEYPWPEMIRQMEEQLVAYQGGVFNKIWDVLGGAVQAVENTGEPVEQALHEVQERGTEILRT